MMMIHIGNEISYKYTLPTTAFTMPVTFGYDNRFDSCLLSVFPRTFRTCVYYVCCIYINIEVHAIDADQH